MIRTFRTRLLIILLLLVAGALTISLAAMGVAVKEQVERSVSQELVVSDRVFRELLDNRSQLLKQAAEVLTDDFGFKRAVATGDRETIVSALVNHGDRIGTELMVLRGPDGAEIAATHSLPASTNTIDSANAGQQLALVGGELFQLITVPVRAPQLIAYATLGFTIDSSLATELQSLANADISLWQESNSSVLASSLSAREQQALSQLLKNGEDLSTWLETQSLVGKEALLSTDSDEQVHVLLSASIEKALQEFNQLQWHIAVIALIAMLLAGVVAILMSRSVSRPLERLIKAAQQLQRGDYGQLRLEQRDDEFGQLAVTFDSMRTAISEREQRISFQAMHDQLTGLPNRRYFADYLGQWLKEQRSGTLLLVNISQFRTLNDSLGQKVGDQVLAQIAQRLSEQSGIEFVARVGGDEFALLYSPLLTEDSSQVNELSRQLAAPVKVGESDYPIAFNCAAVVFPEHGDGFDTLLRRAQVAVQRAKSEHAFVSFYRHGMDEQHLRQLTILEQLQQACDGNELKLLLQPKIDCQTGKTIGAEALLRWHSQVLGFVGPDEFIPLAEQSGLIKQLTRWVCETAVEIIQSLTLRDGAFSLSVNLSAVDLLSDEILRLFDDLKQLQSDIHQYLILEVTESAIVTDPEAAISRLNWLRERGFRVSIDDYGTGYSSLAQMRNLPVNELKIDRAFVQPLANSVVDQSIVRSTIQLAHELNLSVVAEGVEDESSWRLLQQQGCDVLQGFYFSKPIAVAEFKQRLEDEANEN